MSDLVIPLQPVPAQTLNVTLGGQACKLVLTQRLTGLFIDVYANEQPIILGVLCLNNTAIVREAYRGFAGELVFWDTQGSDDPSHEGLGERFTLLYVS